MKQKEIRVLIDRPESAAGQLLTARLQQDPALFVHFLSKPAAEADFIFLCSPDDSSSFIWAEETGTTVIDLSATRTVSPDWAYGLPFLSPAHKKMIAGSKRIALPDPRAAGFVALIYPLISSGLLPASALLTCTILSGGQPEAAPALKDISPRAELKNELTLRSGLCEAPALLLTENASAAGLLTAIPFFAPQLSIPLTRAQLLDFYEKEYGRCPAIRLVKAEDRFPAGTIPVDENLEQPALLLVLGGCEEQITLFAVSDRPNAQLVENAMTCLSLQLEQNTDHSL